jgi:hypothetical protein
MNMFLKTAAAYVFATAISISGFAMADELAKLPDVSTLPKGYYRISPAIPLLGEHYGRGPVGSMPYDPIYCVYKGKIICVEWLFSPADFAAGKNWKNLDGISGMNLPAPDHIDITYEANGHGDWPIPLYNLRSYFVSNTFLANVN